VQGRREPSKPGRQLRGGGGPGQHLFGYQSVRALGQGRDHGVAMGHIPQHLIQALEDAIHVLPQPLLVDERAVPRHPDVHHQGDVRRGAG